MPVYAVTFSHPDEEGWQRHVQPHVQYLVDLLRSGVLLASGPFRRTPQKSALLLIRAADRDELMDIISRDPFAIEGLIADMTVTEWDPLFGAFSADSSMPGRFATPPPSA